MAETFYKKEVEKFQFYQFPKWLLREPYNGLSLRARMVYILLYDRLSLSLKNEWYDTDGKLFVLFSNEHLADKSGGLGCSVPTIIKAKQELAEFGLLYEVRQGLSLSNRIYLLGPGNSRQNLKSFNSRTKENEDRSKDFLVHDIKKFNTNKTENIKTENNNINNNIASDNLELSNAPQEAMSFGQFVRSEGLKVNEKIMQRLLDYVGIDGMELDAVKFAISLTTEQGIEAAAYTFKILDNWKILGIKTLEQARQSTEDFKAKKANQSVKKSPQSTPEWSNPDYKNETTEEELAELERVKQQMLERLNGGGSDA